MNKNIAEAVEIQQEELSAQNLHSLGSEGEKAQGVRIQLLQTCEYENTSAFKWVFPLWFTEIWQSTMEVKLSFIYMTKISLNILETWE